MVVGVIAVLSALAMPRLREVHDRAAARAAIQEASSLFSLARRAAVARRATVGVVIDTQAAAIIVRIGPARIAHQSFRDRYGVLLTASRDSMSYDPRGLGYGAANLTVQARRGRAAETLFVSRLGRTRH